MESEAISEVDEGREADDADDVDDADPTRGVRRALRPKGTIFVGAPFEPFRKLSVLALPTASRPLSASGSETERGPSPGASPHAFDLTGGGRARWPQIRARGARCDCGESHCGFRRDVAGKAHVLGMRTEIGGSDDTMQRSRCSAVALERLLAPSTPKYGSILDSCMASLCQVGDCVAATPAFAVIGANAHKG